MFPTIGNIVVIQETGEVGEVVKIDFTDKEPFRIRLEDGSVTCQTIENIRLVQDFNQTSF